MAGKKKQRARSQEEPKSTLLGPSSPSWYRHPMFWGGGAIALALLIYIVFADNTSQEPSDSGDSIAYEVVGRYPHDPAAWTQGLVVHDGKLYESTGRYGESTLREVEPESGKVLRSIPLAPKYFGEGLARWQDRWLQLTWKENEILAYDTASLELKQTHPWPHEGWGLTTDEQHLIVSDGTDRLFFVDPVTFKEVRHIDVTHRGRRLDRLNELEYINGKIYANVWYRNEIVIIDPQSGNVLKQIDISPLRKETRVASSDAVANGIAYDPATKTLLVTGKLWPTLFRIKLSELP